MLGLLRNIAYGIYSFKGITGCFKRSVISTRPVLLNVPEKREGLLGLIELSVILSALSLVNDILFKHTGIFSIIWGIICIAITVMTFGLLQLVIATSNVISMPASLLLRLLFLYFAISNIILLITSAGILFESSKVELLILILDTLTNLSILGLISD